MKKRSRRNRYDPRWAKENRVSWDVYLRVAGDVTITVAVMAPPDATDMELLTAAASRLKRQRESEYES